MAELKIKTRFTGKNELLIVELSGELDSNAVNEFEKVINEQMQKGHKQIVLDLEELIFISSSGISSIIGLLDELSEMEGKLSTMNAPKPILSTIKLVGISSVLENFLSEDEAINSHT